MARTSAIVSLLMLIQSADAQTQVYDFLDVPQSTLATTLQIPSGFELYIPDTASQVLFNPARAVNTTRKFLFGTYFPSSLDPTVAFAYLSNEWLAQVDNKVNISDLDNTEADQTATLLPDRRDLIDLRSRFKMATRLAALRLRLVNFGRTRYGGFSFGFFGMLRWRTDERLRSTTRISTMLLETSRNRLRRSDSRTTVTDDETDQRGYLLGLEFSLFGGNWDWRGSLAFSRPGADLKVTRILESSRRDSTFTSDVLKEVVLNDDNSSSSSSINQDPATVNLTTYYRKSVGPESSIFLSLDAGHAVDALTDSDFRSIRERLAQRGDEITFSDTIAVQQATGHSGSYNTVALSAGYVWLRRKARFFFMTGLSPGFDYTNFRTLSDTEVRGSSTGRPVVLRDRTFGGEIRLPIYLRYSPVSWASLYGGLNYAYMLRRQETRSELPTGTLEQDKTFRQDNELTNFNSIRRFYLGMVLRHRSGLVALIDPGDDLARLRGWTVSVGYFF